MRGKYRRAVFIVTYSINKNKVEFLILRRKLHWKGWEFPKGGIEFFEMKRRAVERELNEETGLSPQTFSLYSVEVRKGKVRLDEMEHSDYKWVSFDEAIKKLTWPNQRKCLKIVDEFLRKE